MAGGTGNDYYIVDSLLDVVSDSVGTDSVLANVDGYTLGATSEVEWLILGTVILGTGIITTGTGNANANTLVGNVIDNTLVSGGGNDSFYGGEGDDSLVGNAGNETMNGAHGDDIMLGAGGNDYYIVDSTLDVVVESVGNGVDSVLAQVSGYTLADNAEWLIVGSSFAKGLGNAIANTLVGNTANNSLDGGDGADSLDGGSGNDTLLGGLGNDTLLGGTGNDRMLGGGGNDSMLGDTGNDFLLGALSTAFGANEIDTLTGGVGSDTFVLGDAVNAYYNTAANGSDYALITDFASGDKLQLRKFTTGVHANSVKGYVVGAKIYGAVGSANCYLYRDTNNNGIVNAGDNLIAAIRATGGTGVGGALKTSDLNTVGIFV
jgi:Ca2+-binding RTX toxin-like protein